MHNMKIGKDGRGYATVSRDSRMVVAGEVSLDDWDDEELLHGRRRDKGGAFRGPKPRLLPASVVRELQRRRFAKAHALLADSLVDAVQFLRAVLNDKRAPRSARMKAAKQILDRVLGKPIEQARISFDSDGGEPWQRLIAQAIVATAEDTVEGEVIEDE
jgi:hypothetical protein